MACFTLVQNLYGQVNGTRHDDSAGMALVHRHFLPFNNIHGCCPESTLYVSYFQAIKLRADGRRRALYRTLKYVGSKLAVSGVVSIRLVTSTMAVSFRDIALVWGI